MSFWKSLKRWHQSPTQVRRPRGERKSRRPELEVLETRQLLACRVYSNDGLHIYCTEAADEAIVYRTEINGQNFVRLAQRSAGEAANHSSHGPERNLGQITFYGYGGNDS